MTLLLLWVGGMLCYLGREIGTWAREGKFEEGSTFGVELLTALLWPLFATFGLMLTVRRLVRGR